MWHDWSGFTAWTRAPVLAAGRVRLTRNNDCGVVLLRAVELVGKLIIEPDAVDLSGRLIHLCGPGTPAIGRDIGATVVRLDLHLAIFGIDPDVVIVAVRRAKARKRFAAVR